MSAEQKDPKDAKFFDDLAVIKDLLRRIEEGEAIPMLMIYRDPADNRYKSYAYNVRWDEGIVMSALVHQAQLRRGVESPSENGK